MASISSVSGSSSSHSIYGSRNILTGLASGLDTESMIENSIQGYKLKIQNLIGQQTKLTWKQDAVRSVTDKMIALSQKYTSYTSKTNLTSPSFFNNAVITTTSGDNADKASATGRSTSDVKINAVKQLAKAARYSVSAADVFGVDGTATGSRLNLAQAKVSKLTGSMRLSVGSAGKSVDLTFDRTEAYESIDDFVAAINTKLGEQTIGDVKASEMIQAKLENGSIKFVAGSAAKEGDAVWVSGASGSIEKTLGLKPTTSYGGADKSQSSVTAPTGSLYDIQGPVQALSNQTLNVTLDGVTKKVSLGDLHITDEDRENGIDSLEKKLLSNIQDGLKSAFGSKVGVEINDDGALSFTTSSQGSSLKVSSTVGKALGLGSNGVSNYLDTGKTLGEILGRDMGGLESLDAVGDVSKYKLDGEKGTDAAGNSIMRIGGKWKRVDSEGNQLYGLTVNGEQVGAFSTESALDSVISAINRSDAGVKVNYSQLTNKLTFSATETGAQGRIDFGEDLAAKLFGNTGLNQTQDGGVLTDSNGNLLVAGTDEDGKEYYLKQQNDGNYYFCDKNGVILKDYGTFPPANRPAADTSDPAIAELLTNARKGFTAGQDAIFSATVNGDELTLTRSSNTVAIDGLNVTLKGVFNDKAEGEDGESYFERGADGQIRFTGADKIKAGSEVTFSSKADADTIVDAIKSFVEEYNAIAKEAHDAYSTQPLSKSSNVNNYRTYEPLTDEEKEGMSDSEIERYEEKAKTGILFGDSDMRRAYDSLRSAITVYGDDRKAMEAIGLTTSYSDGVTSLSLDEDKLRAALDANPDQVQRVFTDSIEMGASSNGLMARVKKTMDTYASTSIGKYGVLVSKAGTRTSSLTLMHNSYQDQIDNLDTQIDTWQTRMSNQIDYYTRQFTALEQLINEMNSQSSALAGLMGGSGY